MNVLKFRVWDADNKAFAYFDRISFLRGNLSKIMDGIPRLTGQLFAETQHFYKIGKDSISNPNMVSNCTIQQWTGLKDINEQDIYDGDLIEGDGYGPYRVFWNMGAWCSCCYSDAEPISIYQKIKIVSNIFKTPKYEGVQ